MAEANTVTRNLVENKVYFADIINAEIYEGAQVVKDSDLTQLDGESDIVMEDKDGLKRNVQRFRDVVMRMEQGMNVAIIAVENQTNIHYAMPVRNMLYDALSYTKQIENLRRQHEGNEKKWTSKEFLSHMKKTDKLQPVITFVFYYGDEPWDGATDIYGMLGIDIKSEQVKIFQNLLPDYHINLIQVNDMEHIENYKTDLRHLFKLLQYKSDKESFEQYFEEHKEELGHIGKDVAEAMEFFLHETDLIKEATDGEESVDMCKALDDLRNDWKAEGKAEGEAKIKKINSLNHMLAIQGRVADIIKAASDLNYQEELFREFHLG